MDNTTTNTTVPNITTTTALTNATFLEMFNCKVATYQLTELISLKMFQSGQTCTIWSVDLKIFQVLEICVDLCGHIATIWLSVNINFTLCYTQYHWFYKPRLLSNVC